MEVASKNAVVSMLRNSLASITRFVMQLDQVGRSRVIRRLTNGPGNSDEALREVALDIAEGADML